MSLFQSDTAKFSLTINVTMGLRTELHFHKATEFLTAETPSTKQARRRFFQPVVHFVAICIISLSTRMSIFLQSDTAKFSLSIINVTMGLRTELHFHKATEFLTAETNVS